MAGLLDFPNGAAFGTGSPAETAQQPSGLGGLLGGLYNSLGLLAKRAIGNSQTALDTGNYNPAPVMEAAMLPMGTGAIAGVPVRAGEAVLGAGPIRAYHGSPHDFDRFDLSKIGTGEGAQAYGHGLYFAEKEGVAKGYRDQLAGGTYKAGSEIFDPSSLGHLNVRVAARKGIDSGIARAEELLKSQPQNAEMLQRDLQMLMAMKNKGAAPNAGRMYEVNINADPAHFLDWDKAMAADHAAREQLKRMAQKGLDAHEYGVDRQLAKDAFMAAQNPNMTGEGLYRQMTNAIESARPVLKAEGNPRALFGGTGPMATEQFSQSGIPGIKYLDQGSRGAGQGSSNYVVFDDKLIDILRKYGIALPGAAGAVGAMQGQGQGQGT